MFIGHLFQAQMHTNRYMIFFPIGRLKTEHTRLVTRGHWFLPSAEQFFGMIHSSLVPDHHFDDRCSQG